MSMRAIWLAGRSRGFGLLVRWRSLFAGLSNRGLGEMTNGFEIFFVSG